jgi:hypothetical protein
MYPYSEPGEVMHAKIMILWLYKLQNIVVLARMLLDSQLNFEAQCFLWDDMVVM